MKIRQSFVSNSSSSSFIVSKEDRLLAESKGIKCYKVESLIQAIEALEKLMPYFLYNQHNCDLDSLKDLLAEMPDCYITEEVDRDWAYEQQLYFNVFEGDL